MTELQPGAVSGAQAASGAAWLAWVWLIAAGICEVGWAVGLSYIDGFRKLWPSVITVALMIASFVLLAQATRTLPVAMAYAIWVGIGTVGTTAVMIALGKQPINGLQMAFLALVIVGIVGLKLTGAKG